MDDLKTQNPSEKNVNLQTMSSEEIAQLQSQMYEQLIRTQQNLLMIHREIEARIAMSRQPQKTGPKENSIEGQPS